MKIAVVGLWHLGTVTAACLAAHGHTVTAIDEDRDLINGLQNAARLPVAEPGLRELTERALASGSLRLSADLAKVSGNDIVWITYDTPVDENDVADVDFVLGRCAALFPFISDGSVLLISSQLPAGSTPALAQRYAGLGTGRSVSFAYSPENLRLGKAIEVFTKPDRVVVGVDSEAVRARLAKIWEPFRADILWMSVASAEMTKHALNAFLATSVVFINEIAVLCERAGADAMEVEKGLKSDVRIGARAYLHPGNAFAGGTLARDVEFLRAIGGTGGLKVPLLDGVKQSNDLHKGWIRRKLSAIMPDLRSRCVALLGLTYKPGTDTLRRSTAVETALWLTQTGATVQAYDPAVSALPPELQAVSLRSSARDALDGADVVVIATEWPEFKKISASDVVAAMRMPVIVDPVRHLEQMLGNDGRIQYYSIGREHEISR
jgi:UDPglucose 6-dehydrogenase